jgi:branched-chain amino acid transport system ATP-binding protein
MDRREKILKVNNIKKFFGGIMAITDVSFNIEKGTISAVIGPNGAGKTTLINLISGIYKCDSGNVTYKNNNITNLPPYKIVEKKIVRTFQNLQVFANMTVLENVMVGMHNITKYEFINCILHLSMVKKQDKMIKDKSFEILKFFNLENKANFRASALPYGEQKKLELARALAASPELLLLDEPVAGLNLTESQIIGDILIKLKEEFKITILLIEHNMNIVMDLSEKIIVLHYGEKIAEGTPEEIQNNSIVVKAYLGGNCIA